MSRFPARARPALIVVALLLLAWGWTIHRSRVRLLPADRAIQASALSLVDPAGQAVDLDEYAGRVVVVNLWASWCGPCRSEVPGFNRVFEDLRGAGLVMLGVNVEGLSPANLSAAAAELGVRYPVLLPTGALTGTFRSDGVIPHSWLIDREGRVRASHRGYLGESSLRAACRELLTEG